MLRRYSIQIMLVVAMVAAAGFCFSALLDYGHSHSSLASTGRIRSWAGTVKEHPSMPDHHQPINPPGRPAGPGGPHPGPNPAPAPQDHSQADGTGGGNHFLVLLYIYAAGFFLLSGLLFYRYAAGKINFSPGDSRLILIILLVLGLFLRLYLAAVIEGHSGDLSFFRNWSASAARDLTNFYSNSRCDYPPLYIYVLCLLGKTASITSLQPYTTILLKLPSILADLVTAWLICHWSKRCLPERAGVLLAASYIFNPAVFINSAMWGQVDSCYTLLIALAIWALINSKTVFSSGLFSAAILMKPQGIIFLPVLAFDLLRQKNWQSILKALAGFAAVAVIIVLPLAWQQGAAWIIRLFSGTIGEYPFASVNAFNLFYLLGANYVSDSQVPCLFSYHNWGMLFIVLTTAYTWWIYARGNTTRLAAAAALMLIVGVFTLGPSMHERYLFPATALAIMAFIALTDKRFLLLAGGFSISVFINTGMVLLTGSGFGHSSSYGMAAPIVSILNMLLLVYLAWVLYDRTNHRLHTLLPS